MTPSLANRGKLILASATSFIVVGALNASAPLITVGGAVVISFLAAYLWFFPAAILLRRRMVELSWWMPPGELPGGACSANLPLPLHIALRNHGGRRLRVLKLDVLSTTALETPSGLEAVMRAGMQVEIVGQVYARQSGYHVIHGATLHFGDILGLFSLSAYFPNPMPIKVFPRVSELAGNSEQKTQGGTLHQRQGLHQVRRRGLAGELRELRDHNHGDPFKNIAWKATARKRKLIVRELETQIVLTHQFVLDIGSGMRQGKPGQRKLDYAIHLVSNLAKAALDAGDRVGIVTFDSRVYSQVPPGEGRHQYLKIIDRLVETNTIVDEDLTELTNSELVAAIATYLAHQEAVDLRVMQTPALDSAAWSDIQAGPRGELYDLSALDRIVSGLLEVMNSSRKQKRLSLPEWWKKIHVSNGSSPLMADLRLFARFRGIELPYRSDHEFGRRTKGLSEALRQIRTSNRADRVVLVSDMCGIFDDPKADLQELSQAAGRGRGRKLVTLLPFGPSFAEVPFSKPGHIIADILAQEESSTLAHTQSVLSSKGIPVLVVGPQDGVSTVSQKLSRLTSGNRRRLA